MNWLFNNFVFEFVIENSNKKNEKKNYVDELFDEIVCTDCRVLVTIMREKQMTSMRKRNG